MAARLYGKYVHGSSSTHIFTTVFPAPEVFFFFLLSPHSPHSLSCFLFSSSFFRGKLPIQHFLRPSIKHLWRWEQEEQCLEQTVVHFTEILGSYMTFPWFCSPGSRHGSRGVLCTSGSHAKLSMGCFYIWETLLLNCNMKKKGIGKSFRVFKRELLTAR